MKMGKEFIRIYDLEDLNADLEYFIDLGITEEEAKSYIKFLLNSMPSKEVLKELEK